MKTIKLLCENIECGKFFVRKYSEHSKNLNRGLTHTFCCASCAAKTRNKNMSSEYWKLQYEKTKKHFDIKYYAGNRKSKFSPFKQFLNKAKCRSKNTTYICDLDLNYLKKLWDSQGGKCIYTNINMILPSTQKEYQNIHSLKKASLDRIDSSKGYIKGNVEFVCLAINYAKSTFSKMEMESFIRDLKLSI